MKIGTCTSTISRLLLHPLILSGINMMRKITKDNSGVTILQKVSQRAFFSILFSEGLKIDILDNVRTCSTLLFEIYDYQKPGLAKGKCSLNEFCF